jgi:DNA-binding NtrC family response regulator
MKESVPVILIVDDDEVAVEILRANVYALGFDKIVAVHNGADALEVVRSRPITVVLLDLFMPGMSGTEVLETLVQEFPRIPVIVLTVHDSVEAAVQCMRIGAFDYMTKPVDHNRLGSAINHAVRVQDLESRLNLFGEEPDEVQGPRDPRPFSGILTTSPKMKAIFQYVEAIAPSPKPVLITGESGTGKELLARSIHAASGRSGPFVTVNVAGLDDVMFSDTLFGHHRGAFTGADRERSGLIAKANQGTLFLDEIGDLEPASQIKLLRLLQENEYYPLGSDEPVQTTTRVVAATNSDLQQKQKKGAFRRDLYYRLISHLVHVPPLRERSRDIQLLLEHFVSEAAATLGRSAPIIGAGVIDILQSYDFPGNIRELQAIVVDAVSRTKGTEMPDAVVEQFLYRHRSEGIPATDLPQDDRRFNWTGSFPKMTEVEQFLIDEAMARTGNNQSAAARLLGVSQSTISRKTRKTP